MPRNTPMNPKWTTNKQSKVYAVFKGRRTGIFNNYGECEKHINGFPGAVHKSFPNRPRAESWLRDLLAADLEMENIRLSKLYPDSDEASQSSGSDVTGEESGLEAEAEAEGEYKNSIPLNYPSLDNSISPLRPQYPSPAQEEPIYITSSSSSAPDDIVQAPIQETLEPVDDNNLPPVPPLSPEQKNVLDLVLAGRNVFFTGPAGSGKSLILKHIKYHLTAQMRGFAITAPTGVAANIIGGVTIYSWSGVGKGDKGILEYLGEARQSRMGGTIPQSAINAWNKAKVLIVDEVSMLSPDLFEKLNEIAKAKFYSGIGHNKHLPFAGIQLVFCGDFFQLPPVDRESDKTCYKCGLPVIPSSVRDYLPKNHPDIQKIRFLNHIHSIGVDCERWTVCNRFLDKKQQTEECGHLWNDSLKYCFQTPTWYEIKFVPVILEKVHRQQDQEWVKMLERIKIGDASSDILDYLDGLKRPLVSKDGIKPTKLYTHKKPVDRENQEEFKKLQSQMYPFDAVDRGNFCAEDSFQRRDLTTEELEEHYFFRNHSIPREVLLKHKAQVMLLSNISASNRLVNGSRGIVCGFIFYNLEKLLETAMRLSDHGKLRSNTERSIQTYFNARQVGGSVRIPLVKFDACSKNAPSPYPILPVYSDAVVPTYFNYADGKPGRNTIYVHRIQIPLMLAWAMTIHKSQGRTLDYVSVDVSQSFAAGQAYVGLSRCVAPEKMQVLGGSRDLARAFKVDPAVLAFYKHMRSGKSVEEEVRKKEVRKKGKRKRNRSVEWQRAHATETGRRKGRFS